jgi:hypothetical protein
MFASSEDFGLTVLVILDNHLQQFFEMVSEMDDVTRASSRERDFLWNQATRFLEKLDDREPPSVVIPQCLRRKPAGIGDTPEQSTANKKRKLSKTESDKQEVTNPEPQQDWSVPEGKTFLEFFGKKSTIDQGAWPRLVDPRFDEPKSMCVRYQVKGKCTHRCTLAHVPKSKMSAKIETAITAKFRKIYKN